MGHLQAEPEVWRGAEEAREPERGVGGDRALAADDLCDAVGRHADRLGERIGAEPERREKILRENRAGVDRANRPGVRVDDLGVVESGIVGMLIASSLSCRVGSPILH